MKMYKGVLQKLEQNRIKRGIIPLNTGLKFKLSKLLYFLSLVYAAFTTLVFIVGVAMKAAFSQDSFWEFISERTVDYSTAIIGLALLIVGFVLTFKKYRTVTTASLALILTLISAVVLIFFFKNELIDSLTDKVFVKFYWRHLIPLGLTAILSAIVCGLDLAEKIKVNREYSSILEAIYETYKKTADNDEISEEEWDEFLESYNPETYRPQFKKNREENGEE